MYDGVYAEKIRRRSAVVKLSDQVRPHLNTPNPVVCVIQRRERTAMVKATVAPGDHAARKRARRSGREKGCHVYLPAELIGKLADSPDLYYRLAGGERGRVVVTLYTEP